MIVADNTVRDNATPLQEEKFTLRHLKRAELG